MKQLATKQYLYSPSDLVAFLECSYKTYLSIKSLYQEISRTEPQAFTQMLWQRGLKHETDYLQKLIDSNQTVTKIPTTGNLSERAIATAEAMRAGADIIYQGALFNQPWQGIADFLIKCDRPSALGDFSYEVLDTKLSNIAQPKHIIQLCVYSELVVSIQGVRPLNMYILLNNEQKVCFKLDDFFFYYARTKQRFENHIKHINDKIIYPQPCRHCNVCEWRTHCQTQWQQDKHLNLVANIQRQQIKNLNRSGIHTITELATVPPDTKTADLTKSTFLKLRTQASLQDYKMRTGKNKYEIIKSRPNKGFALLPLPNKADLFFDIESSSFYPGTLIYLFGLYSCLNNKEIFKTFWGHDHEQEKENFNQLMDFLELHLMKYPDAHIYHYGHYETVALKRISCRYAIHEGLLAKLIRTRRFVDLYDVVREGVYISEPAYTLKNLENFYMEQRTDNIVQALDSIVVYNEWCETKDHKLLQQIADYNKADCRSIYLLRDWLVRIKPKQIPWREKVSAESLTEEWQIEYENYRGWLGLTNENPPILYHRLAHLLEFHNRESQAGQWDNYDLQNDSESNLAANPHCLVELQQVATSQSANNRLIYTYRFPPQECALKVSRKIIDIETMEGVGEIGKLDSALGIIKIRTKKNTPPLPKQLSIGVSDLIDSSIIRSSLYRYANHLINTPNIAHVANELLTRNRPRIKNKTFGETIVNSDDLYGETLKTVRGLNTSYLVIQGPPGSGKTNISSRLIVDLIKQGKKVGVSSNSHQAIHHLLKKIEEVAVQEGQHFCGIKKAISGSKKSSYDGNFINSVASIREIDFNADLYAGTVWTFSSPYFDNRLDYLFIDEAGQVSTANAIAMSNATKNMILVGDPMQLSQPTRGIHPQQSGLSILEFLLDGQPIISKKQGIFLDQSYRLKPAICRFISDALYQGRLTSHQITCARKLHFQGTKLPSEGIVIVNADHQGNSSRSSEEADVIKNLYHTILGQTFTDIDGSQRSITTADILVVTPYNMQVEYLCSILPDGAQIGSVDKFQGQEAPVVLVSMVSSSMEYLSKKIIEFLYSRNRLNVALSRAQCLAILVASDRLMEVVCSTVEQMKLVNTYCRLYDYAHKLTIPP